MHFQTTNAIPRADRQKRNGQPQQEIKWELDDISIIKSNLSDKIYQENFILPKKSLSWFIRLQ